MTHLDWLVQHPSEPKPHTTKSFPNPAPKPKTTELPLKQTTHESGTVTAWNYNPPDLTESQVTQLANRPWHETEKQLNPAGDPPPDYFKPMKFERHDIPEPTVSFEDGIKTVTQHAPSIARHVKTTPIAPGETVPRKKIVGARSRKVGS